MALTDTQIENIQIDYGIVFVNYGKDDQKQLGPTRGGGEFIVTKNIRDIEFDGRKGKTKGLQVVDEIDAQLTVTHLDASLDTLKLAMPYAEKEGNKITCTGASIGVIPDNAYLDNITMFCKTVGGDYKKITLYNGMSEADFTLTAAPKGEGEMPLEIYAHWDATKIDSESVLYEIEDVTSIEVNGDPLMVLSTTPPNGGIDVSVDSDLVATFNTKIQPYDVNFANFKLVEAESGGVVSGTFDYDSGEKKVTFAHDGLEGDTSYYWIIDRVRSLAGNRVSVTVVNFTTEYAG